MKPVVKLGDIAFLNPKPEKGLSELDTVSFLPLASVNIDGSTSAGNDSLRKDVCKGHPYFRRGDILVAKITPSFENGKIAIADTLHADGYSSTEFHVVRAKEALVHPLYLLAFLRSGIVRHYCAVHMKGSAGQKRVPADVLKRLQLRLPDYETQCERTRQFALTSQHIAAAKLHIKELDELVKSRFVEMFGDPIANPMRWNLKPIGEVYVVGSSKRVYARDQVSEGVPFLRLGDLTNRIQHGIESCDLFISEELYSEHKARGLVPTAGDILVTARGTMGLCYTVREHDRFYFQDGMITWLHAKPISPLPVFLTNLFSNAHFSEDLHSHTSGTTVKYLSIKALSQMPIIIPPVTLQQEFAAFVAQVDQLKADTQLAIDKLQMLYDSLAQEYFSE